jgi:hypothetical protein
MDDPRAAKGDLVLAGREAALEDGMIGRCRAVGVIKRVKLGRGERRQRRGIRSGCAAARKKEPCAVLPTAPGFLFNCTKALSGGFIWEVQFFVKKKAKT